MLFTVFASCDKNNDKSANSTANTTDANNASVTSTEGNNKEPADPPPAENNEFKVPTANYGGKEFNILAPSYLYSDFLKYEDTANAIDLAIYQRDSKIKSHLGVTIKNHLVGATNKRDIISSFNTLKANHDSGDDAYQLYLTDASGAVLKLATQHYVSDLQTFEDINLNADYWNKEVMEELEYNSKLYYGVSDYMIANPNVVFFNKTMQKNYKVNNPYDMVRNGSWTLENMITESKKVNDEGDKATKNLGFACGDDWHFVSLLDSCGVEIVKDGGDGYWNLNLNLNNKRHTIVYQLLTDLFDSNSTLIYKEKITGIADDDKSITSGRVLFTFAPLNEAIDYRASSVDFGVLPYPKYDTTEKEYRSFNWSGFMCVPSTAKDKKLIGQVLESLSYFSSADNNNIRNAYYQQLIAASPDDNQMIQIIYNNIVVNRAINFVGGDGKGDSEYYKRFTSLYNLIYTYQNLAKSYSRSTSADSIALAWASYGPSAQSAIDIIYNI